MDRITEIRTRDVAEYISVDAPRLQVDLPALREAILIKVIPAVEEHMRRAGTDLWIPTEIEYLDQHARRRTLHGVR